MIALAAEALRFGEQAEDEVLGPALGVAGGLGLVRGRPITTFRARGV